MHTCPILHNGDSKPVTQKSAKPRNRSELPILKKELALFGPVPRSPQPTRPAAPTNATLCNTNSQKTRLLIGVNRRGSAAIPSLVFKQPGILHQAPRRKPAWTQMPCTPAQFCTTPLRKPRPKRLPNSTSQRTYHTKIKNWLCSNQSPRIRVQTLNAQKCPN